MTHKKILPGGYPRSVNHWEALRSITHDIPLGLAAFTVKAAEQFGNIWSEAFPTDEADDADLLDRVWDIPESLTASRTAFDEWGAWLVKHDLKNEVFRRLGTAARILARLPTWEPDFAKASTPHDIATTSYYFPRMTLPTRQLVTQWVRIASTLNSSTCGASEAVRYVYWFEAYLS